MKEPNTQWLLARKEAADDLGKEAATLAIWAYTGRYDFPYIKVGRLARYRTENLDNYIKSRTVCSAN